VRAALCALDLRPAPPTALRERLEAELEARGSEALHADLSERDPAAADAIEPRDRSRVLRALALAEMGERPPETGAGSQLWTDEMRVPTVLLGLVMDRERLYERIDARVEAIVAAGAIEEVRRAEAAGASRTARAALGYRELLEGDVEAMRVRTRRYAKRQLTWMRKLAGVRTVDADAGTAADIAAVVMRSLPAMP
jgi:tRNA dimethylallyltransferase